MLKQELILGLFIIDWHVAWNKKELVFMLANKHKTRRMYFIKHMKYLNTKNCKNWDNNSENIYEDGNKVQKQKNQ